MYGTECLMGGENAEINQLSFLNDTQKAEKIKYLLIENIWQFYLH